MAGVYSVTQVNSYIKNMFVQDFLLRRISVKGEVSNCKYHSSGHIYFTLKDSGGTLSAVMFAGQRKGLGFRLAEGQQVVVKGPLTFTSGTEDTSFTRRRSSWQAGATCTSGLKSFCGSWKRWGCLRPSISGRSPDMPCP